MPFPQVLTNKFERNLKIGAQWLDRKLGQTLNRERNHHNECKNMGSNFMMRCHQLIHLRRDYIFIYFGSKVHYCNIWTFRSLYMRLHVILKSFITIKSRFSVVLLCLQSFQSRQSHTLTKRNESMGHCFTINSLFIPNWNIDIWVTHFTTWIHTFLSCVGQITCISVVQKI